MPSVSRILTIMKVMTKTPAVWQVQGACKPSSLMAAMSGTTPRRDPPYIKEDDRKGIIWLYKFTYENQPLNDCLFLDYVYEPNPAGCRPKYPLIHEIKYGHYLSREWIHR